MIRAGYQVSLVVGRDYEADPKWDIGEISVYQIKSMVKYIDPVQDIRAFFSLYRLLREIRPDVVHTHLAKAGVIGRWAAFFCGQVPLILHTVHGPTFAPTLPVYRRVLYKSIERLSGFITDHFIFVGEEIRDEYILAKVCNESKSTVIYTGRPDEEVDRISCISQNRLRAIRKLFFSRDDPFLLATVGRLVRSKQQDHAIRVVYELRRRNIDCKLLLIGVAFIREERHYVQYLKKLVTQLNLEEHVHFCGYREDVLEIMAACDAILEGLPNIVVEAGLACKPIVCYEVTGVKEIIEEGRTGYIVKQGDIIGATAALFYLATHQEQAKRMGLLAHNGVKKEHRESSMNEKKLYMYRNLFRSLSNKI
jgi:glycosyltransferase involved in cell wall biosynthesis